MFQVKKDTNYLLIPDNPDLSIVDAFAIKVNPPNMINPQKTLQKRRWTCSRYV